MPEEQSVTCHYCRAENDADDHRCSRCGRRLNESQDHRQRGFPVQMTAVAPKVESSPEAVAGSGATAIPGPQLVTKLPAGSPVNRSAVQPSLFGPMEVRQDSASEGNRVVTPSPAFRRRLPRPEQTSLDFEVANGGDAFAVSLEARNSQIEVAPTTSRIFAAVVDAAVPCMGFALFATAFQLTAGSVEVSARTVPFYAAAAVLILLVYRLVWCAAGMDTPGLQAAGLRLLNLDGRRPARRARFQRLAGGLVSLLAAGIGLVWALLDEKHFTWHDYMSGTFPAPRS